MSRKKKDMVGLRNELKEFLEKIGLSDPRSIQKQLNISQPVFSRLAASMRSDLLIVGRARSTRYALPRAIHDIGASFPVYEILEDGGCQEVAILHAILPRGFFVESHAKNIRQEYHDDLPYFLDGLRPVGFLGRMIPKQHPELELPLDIRNWSADHCLRYLCRMGWNLSGNFIVGDDAQRLWQHNVKKPPDIVDSTRPEREYPIKAQEVLSHGTPGSSAAGEQPKFLATRSTDLKPIIVKFVLNTQSRAGRRSADLLVGEHVAHEVLSEYGQEATQSELITGADDELFLEMERFDRIGAHGRRGLITLQALDSQFLGSLSSWSDSAQKLAAQQIITKTMAQNIRWLELFGSLICNTDMHHGNVSFISEGSVIRELAPVYDMLPMLYAPREHSPVPQDGLSRTMQATQTEFTSTLERNAVAEYVSPRASGPDWALPTRNPHNDDIWDAVVGSAIAYWQKVSSHPLASESFRSIAQGNIAKIQTGQ